jgi:tetratricopeptide (TPR) repeat protein
MVPLDAVATDPEAQRALGVALNLAVWRALERLDRTADDDQRVVDAAHASLWHWAQVGTSENLARGEWLVSRAYAVVGRAEPALHHARRCLAATEAAGLGDFDAFYAYEAMARALALAGDHAEAAGWKQRAVEQLEAVEDPEDRTICESDLAAGPWYGLP